MAETKINSQHSHVQYIVAGGWQSKTTRKDISMDHITRGNQGKNEKKREKLTSFDGPGR